MKIQLAQLDLLRPWPTLTLREGYHAIRILVRVGTVPIGEVMTRPKRCPTVLPNRLSRRIVRRLTPALLRHLSRCALAAGPEAIAKLPPLPGRYVGSGSTWKSAARTLLKQILLPGGLSEPWRTICAQSQGEDRFECPPITVAVCTRDRPQELQQCIEHLLKLDYPEFEILICDNSKDPAATRKIAEQYDVAYTRAPIAGLSRARNVALAAAEHRWVAFTDDDCRPEPNWLRELARELQDTHCRCVTGLVLPAQLENSAEITFEIYGGLGRGYAPLVFDPTYPRAHRWAPAKTWLIGAGANMLLDRELVRELGGFDPDMGPGGVGGCGEDTLVFYQLLKSGCNIHYTPRAIVHHFHRSSDEALRKQIYSYAVGHAAYHVRCFWSYRDHRSLLQLIYHLPRWFARNFRRGIGARTKYPFSLVPLEAKGTFAGAVRYPAVKVRRFLESLFKQKTAAYKTPPGPRIVSDRPKDYDATSVKKSFRAA